MSICVVWVRQHTLRAWLCDFLSVTTIRLIKAGKVAEVGELLQKKGIYYRLNRAQL